MPANYDTDRDGILNIDEGNTYGTNPNSADTDGDGLSDGDELDYWGDTWDVDHDGDGLHNLIDADSDGDGYEDGQEVSVGSDPSDPDSVPLSTNVYEDAEDGTTNGWGIYDNSPEGAVIENIFDDERQSRVIRFTGNGRDNGYFLRTEDLRWWHDSAHFFVEWSMKYSEVFTVYVKIKTSNGDRSLYYTPEDVNRLGSDRYIHHGLGSDVVDGQWHTFVRDLSADLEEAQPDATILEVNIFSIRGSGSVDDIKLHNQIPID
jgi:hypothetical protein